MHTIDRLLDLIEDGAWHNLEKLSRNSDIPKQKLVTLARMLTEASIVEYRNHEEKVRLKGEWKRMFTKNEREEKLERTAVGTIILPPKRSIEIQNIQITNLTKKELELGVRVNKKLKELAIGMLE